MNDTPTPSGRRFRPDHGGDDADSEPTLQRRGGGLRPIGAIVAPIAARAGVRIPQAAEPDDGLHVCLDHRAAARALGEGIARGDFGPFRLMLAAAPAVDAFAFLARMVAGDPDLAAAAIAARAATGVGTDA